MQSRWHVDRWPAGPCCQQRSRDEEVWDCSTAVLDLLHRASLRGLLSSAEGLGPRDVRDGAERINEAHFIDGAAGHVEETRAGEDNGKRLGTRDGDVEAVDAEQELDVARKFFAVSVGFTAAAAIVHELMEARDEKRLLRLQRRLAAYKLLIVDELGYVPLSQTGAELLFEVFSQRYERGSTIVTSNLPFDEWTSVFGAERLTGALLDRLTHHVHILEMNGDSYRLAHSKRRSRRPRADTAPEAVPPD